MVWAAEPILCPKRLHHLPLCPAPPPPAPLSTVAPVWGLRWEPPLCRGCLPLPRAPLAALGSFPRAGLEVL